MPVVVDPPWTKESDEKSGKPPVSGVWIPGGNPTARQNPGCLFLVFELLHFLLRFLHFFKPGLPLRFGFRFTAVFLQLGQNLAVVDNIILNDKLQDEGDDIRHGIVPGERRWQSIEK